MAAALQMLPGYWTTSGRNEFGERVLVLHHEHFGELSDHDCYAEAINAAVEHSDDLADEASAQAAAVAEAAYEATLETLHALISGSRIHANAGDDAARGERRAIKAVLTAIDTISMAPVGARFVAAQTMGAR